MLPAEISGTNPNQKNNNAYASLYTFNTFGGAQINYLM